MKRAALLLALWPRRLRPARAAAARARRGDAARAGDGEPAADHRRTARRRRRSPGPGRVDELLRRSEEREDDRFDLPPGDIPVDDGNASSDRARMKPVRKAVFPVAGLGTRFLPATKAIPKEMLTVVDRPLIQYAVEEAREAGIEQMIFVTGRGKGALEDHFDIAYELEAVMTGARQVARRARRHPLPARRDRLGPPAGAARPRPRRLVRARDRRRRAVRGAAPRRSDGRPARLPRADGRGL